MGELGYKVKAFCFQDSPRRAHSIAAQGGINAAKNYPKALLHFNIALDIDPKDSNMAKSLIEVRIYRILHLPQ